MRAGSDSAFAFIKAAEFKMFEMDFPHSFPNGLQSDFLSGQGLADGEVLSLPLDLAGGLHAALLPSVRIAALLR